MPVDWDGLEIALTSSTGGEWTWYFDLLTGAVRMSRAESLIGDKVEGLSEGDIQAGLQAGRLIEIEPLRPEMEYASMAAFALLLPDVALRERLLAALDGPGAFARFKDILAGVPDDLERWYAYQQECVRGAMFRWLAGHNLEATTEPPEGPSA